MSESSAPSRDPLTAPRPHHATGRTWTTRKKDIDAPRGVYRHPSGAWAIRYHCGQGHLHKERVGPNKREAERLLDQRRVRRAQEPAWCPAAERRQTSERARAEQEREARRLTFRRYADQYIAWAKLHHRGWKTEEGRVTAMVAAFGDTPLDALTIADVVGFLDGLLARRAQATRNRYRTTLHAMLNRAIRHGHLAANPVTGVAKGREPEGRLLWLTVEDEAAVRDQLAPEATVTGRRSLDARRGDLRPLFTVSLHTGLRWSEQRRLQWRDVDVLTGLITVRESKSGYSRQVPMNRVVRSVLMDLAGQRSRPGDPEEVMFRCSYTGPDNFFPQAAERAQVALTHAGKDGTRLEGYTWHCNRHTFASRLVMAGVDLRTVQVLGGWRTLAMVQRYSHMAPDHLRAAVERLVPEGLAMPPAEPKTGASTARIYPETSPTAADVETRVS